MFIKRLLIEGVRNLEPVSLDNLSELNFFIGENGAGKTSLLEAICFVSLGRSFRANKVQTVIHHDAPSLKVFVECEDIISQRSHRIGIERDKKSDYLIRIDGANAHALAELSSLLPVVVLDANAFDLLDGSPSVRRKFIDWGVFHVEHGFYEEWKSFNRILTQRNALLHNQVADYSMYEAWDKQFVSHAIAIDALRRQYLGAFQERLAIAIDALDAEAGHDIFYKNGWALEKADLAEEGSLSRSHDPEELHLLLRRNFSRDLKQQATHLGPHKADMQLRISGKDVRDVYSRGQKKTLVSAMKIAQAQTVKESQSHKMPVLLLDDLPSELDDRHLSQFLQYVHLQGFQCFVTAITDRACKLIPSTNARMFHVERGKIVPL